ncbi:VanZ family protein [Terrilactibacillus sp. S3-3]|nr:VanZ family protein [Terrilactibacillus sp. S3-3]
MMDNPFEPNILSFFLVYGILLSLCLIWSKFVRKHLTFNRGVYLSLFVYYLLMVVVLTLLPLSIGPAIMAKSSTSFSSINLVPFKTLVLYGQTSQGRWTIVCHVLLLMPLMFFVGFAKRGQSSILKMIFTGFLVSCFLESVQWVLGSQAILNNHICNIDDVMMNTFGAGLAAVIFKTMSKNEWLKKYITDWMSF